MEKHIRIETDFNLVKRGDYFEDFNYDSTKFVLNMDKEDIKRLRKNHQIMKDNPDIISVGLNNTEMAGLVDLSDEDAHDEYVDVTLHSNGVLYLRYENDDEMILDCSIDINKFLNNDYLIYSSV